MMGSTGWVLVETLSLINLVISTPQFSQPSNEGIALLRQARDTPMSHRIRAFTNLLLFVQIIVLIGCRQLNTGVASLSQNNPFGENRSLKGTSC